MARNDRVCVWPGAEGIFSSRTTKSLGEEPKGILILGAKRTLTYAFSGDVNEIKQRTQRGKRFGRCERIVQCNFFVVTVVGKISKRFIW